MLGPSHYPEREICRQNVHVSLFVVSLPDSFFISEQVDREGSAHRDDVQIGDSLVYIDLFDVQEVGPCALCPFVLI